MKLEKILLAVMAVAAIAAIATLRAMGKPVGDELPAALAASVLTFAALSGINLPTGGAGGAGSFLAGLFTGLAQRREQEAVKRAEALLARAKGQGRESDDTGTNEAAH
jgi:hypothetical protein